MIATIRTDVRNPWIDRFGVKKNTETTEEDKKWEKMVMTRSFPAEGRELDQ